MKDVCRGDKMMRKKMNANRICWSLSKHLLLIVTSVIVLLPLVTCVFAAFKPSAEYAGTSAVTPPSDWLYLDNFREAWTKGNMLHAFYDTGIILLFVLIINTLISSMVAFVINRFRFRGRKFILSLYIYMAVVPAVAMQVATYKIMYTLHLVNSLVGYIILLVGADVISINIFLPILEGISSTIDEAAIVDGCSYFGVFFRIVFPLLKPAIITNMIIKGVAVYNEYYLAQLYLQDQNKLGVVSTALVMFTGPKGSDYFYICAGVLITVIPILCIFILARNQIRSGMVAGAIKE